MGREIRMKDGMYSIRSTVSDEQLHDKEWITEFEAKEVLINDALRTFINEVIQIDIDFPNGWVISTDKAFIHYNPKEVKFYDWHIEILEKENYSENIYEKFNEINKKYKIFELEEDE